MKLFFIILAVCILNTSDSFSQTQWPPEYEIKSDTAIWQDITPGYWMMLEDKNDKWKLNSVLAMNEAGKFHSITANYDSTVDTYWIVYRLRNTMNRQARISLNSMSDFDEFYVKDDSARWQHFTSGKLNDWEKKDGLKTADCIPVEMQPNESYLVYQRISNTKPGLAEHFQIAIVSTDKMIQQYYIDHVEKRENYFSPVNLQEAFIIGMVFLAAFMNFFFYRIVKEKVYLYFALFAFFLGINRCYGISSSYFIVFNQQKLQYVMYLGYAWIFISFFLIQFFRYFIGTQNKFPRLDKWFFRLTTIFMVLFLLHGLLQVFQVQGLPWFRSVLSTVINLFIPFVFLFIPVVLLLLQGLNLKKSGRANHFVLFGSLPFLLLYILAHFFSPGGFYLNSNNPFTRFFSLYFRLTEAACLAVMLVSFTWVLFMRFIDLRKENAQQALDKERLAKEKEIERNELIANQKIQLEKDVLERTTELKQSLEELKATQSQLIQSEKMASLGELTAGIAHEIQNPLNFVNNFSEVNTELIEELKGERQKTEGERNAQLEDEILNDLSNNLGKITHHGKRADAIVKGMLQHSRSSNGIKESTNINTLADEYLRLSFHGLRAKDKSFNAIMKTDFDNSIGNINIIPQDIGRVLLNLYNNAFFAVSEKQKAGSNHFEPQVTVTTKKINDTVEIKVADNGNGIPEKVLDKIFQPFFTTKPTGQGTGLGLSLSYDIVNAHGGVLKVESKEGEGSEFIVSIPFV